MPVRVVYIAGYGHSGSTLLNILLGQHPDLMGAGELFRLPAAWAAEEFCSCGEPLTRCPVWREIVHRWRRSTDDEPVSTYGRLQTSFEGWLPRGRAGDSSAWRAYAEQTVSLFQAIRDVTGRDVIVDSSKLPARARALARMPGIDLRILHLVRDGRGVAWSLRRRLARDPRAGIQTEKQARSVLRTGIVWMATNLATEHVARRLPVGQALRLGYEELVGDTDAVLARIGTTVEVDLARVAEALAARAPLEVGHVMAGNRLRMDSAVLLRPDLEWQQRLPIPQRRLLEGVCRPLLRRYGYLPAVTGLP